MIRHQRLDLLDVLIRESESAANIFGHPCAHFDVSIEAYAGAWAGRGAKSRGLADIVEQDAPGKRGRAIGRQHLKHHARVNPDVALWVELRRLLYPFHPCNVRQDYSKKPSIVKQFE